MTDAWEMHQAETGLNPGPVWRDRGVIIANLTRDKQALEERVAELEGSCQKLRDDYQGALAERDQARAEVESLRGEVSWHDRHATVIEAMLADAQSRVLAVEPTHAADLNPENNGPTLDEVDPRLIKALRPLVARYGDMGVKRTVDLLRGDTP